MTHIRAEVPKVLREVYILHSKICVQQPLSTRYVPGIVGQLDTVVVPLNSYGSAGPQGSLLHE